MKLVIYGIVERKFTPEGKTEEATYRRIYGKEVFDDEKQTTKKDNVFLGSVCREYKCRPFVFESLPDDPKVYENGLECDVSFDFYKYIDDVDY